MGPAIQTEQQADPREVGMIISDEAKKIAYQIGMSSLTPLIQRILDLERRMSEMEPKESPHRKGIERR